MTHAMTEETKAQLLRAAETAHIAATAALQHAEVARLQAEKALGAVTATLEEVRRIVAL